MTEVPHVEFRDVHVSYPGQYQALDGVTLQIARGQFVFVVGKTGAGKSTLIRVITREVKHTQGEVRIDGKENGDYKDHNLHKLRRQMGIVPQDYALLPNKRVWENVAYAMRAVGHSKREIRIKVPEILEQVQIAHRADALPHQLSGGEQQRVAIGRALINHPPLLIADEPTGNLDPEVSAELMELLLRLNANGTTVLIASHDMPVVEKYARRVIRLEQGKIVEDSHPGPN